MSKTPFEIYAERLADSHITQQIMGDVAETVKNKPDLYRWVCGHTVAYDYIAESALNEIGRKWCGLYAMEKWRDTLGYYLKSTKNPICALVYMCAVMGVVQLHKELLTNEVYPECKEYL